MNALSRVWGRGTMLGAAGFFLAIHCVACGSGDTDGAGGVGSSGGPEGPPAGGAPGPTETGKPAGVTTTSYYVYDLEGRVLGEYDPAGKAVEELVYVDDRLVASARGNDLHPVFTDQVGAPRMVANASGKPLWRWGGEPFGASAPEADADGDGSPLTFSSRFPGQIADPETGLFYNYFRDYAPALGRYIESDPIGLAGGLNRYMYVAGDPLNDSDRLGLAPDKVPNDPQVGTIGSIVPVGNIPFPTAFPREDLERRIDSARREIEREASARNESGFSIVRERRNLPGADQQVLAALDRYFYIKDFVCPDTQPSGPLGGAYQLGIGVVGGVVDYFMKLKDPSRGRSRADFSQISWSAKGGWEPCPRRCKP